jgi:hypothetical protein
MIEIRNAFKILLKIVKGKYHLGDPDVNERIILELLIDRKYA